MPDRILVIEDDLLIQDMVREALDEGGFQTEITASGEEAIVLLQEGDAKYRALLTDINLKGGITGWDVAKRAREINPEIPVVSIRELATLFTQVRPEKGLKLVFTNDADERAYSQSKGQGLDSARLAGLGWSAQVDLPTGLARMVTALDFEANLGRG